MPETTEEYILVISYYESLVQQWEAWSVAIIESNGGTE